MLVFVILAKIELDPRRHCSGQELRQLARPAATSGARRASKIAQETLERAGNNWGPSMGRIGRRANDLRAIDWRRPPNWLRASLLGRPINQPAGWLAGKPVCLSCRPAACIPGRARMRARLFAGPPGSRDLPWLID